MRTAQRGASGVLILVILALVIVALVAMAVLSRSGSARNEREDTLARLARAATALDAFAGAAGRLPCPARGADNTGAEVPAGGATNCTEAEGTLPWATIGLRRDDAFDAWGRKISYRVYDGNRGLTQVGGASMVACDTVEPTPGGVVAGNLCNANADIYARNTTPAQFLAGKGFTVTDFGVDHPDTAYVLLSFGLTGMGGYSASGVQLDLPNGDEKKNAQSGPYTIKAFSDPDTAAGTAAFFDDVIIYRGISDMVAKASLAARDWPEGAVFNAATVGTAVGTSAGHTFNFMGNTYGAFSDTNTSRNVILDSSGGTEGIGSAAAAGSSTNNGLATTEFIRIQLSQSAGHVAFTLNGFDTFTVGTKFREQVQVRFYNGSAIGTRGTQVGSAVVKQACRASGSVLSTILIDPSLAGATFNQVEIEPLDLTPFAFGIDTGVLVSEFAACQLSSACSTTLSTSTNLCTNALANAAFSPTTVAPNVAAALTFTITNGTDNPAQNGIGFTETLPSGLVVAAAPGVQTTCPAGGSSFAVPASPVTVTKPDGTALTAGSTAIKVSEVSLNNNVSSCQVRLNVSASVAAAYTHASSNVASLANVANAVTNATLTVQ
jgi:type II secretory pathway pseudopilin PulG